MASKDAAPSPLPEVSPQETADGDKFDCPPPWWLALIAMAMSLMTTMTVAGSLFFVLAAPEKVSPHCREFDVSAFQGLCTFSVCCFWTYPVVCCLFTVLVFAKNMVDQRVYYEFLLHKVHIGFDRANPFAYSIVIFLIVYALLAFSALIWLGINNDKKAASPIDTVFSSLAYISPIVSFLAILIAQWSIQGKLVTLPNFLEFYKWGVDHLSGSTNYHIHYIHHGYTRLEQALDKSDEKELDTPRMIALVEHYAKELEAEAAADIAAKEKASGSTPADVEVAKQEAQVSPPPSVRDKTFAVVGNLGAAAGSLKSVALDDRAYVYWQARLLFNPRLQDERSQDFRNWAIGYFISVVLAIVLSVYLFICLLITCLEMEKVLVKGSTTWEWTHPLSLRPNYNHDADVALYKNFKQVAAKAAVNMLRQGARTFKAGASSMSQFQLGVAA